jgi:hypothetical protein
MRNTNGTIKTKRMNTETPDDLMEDSGDAKETNNREENLQSISWQAGRGSRTMGPERHEISYPKRTQGMSRATRKHHQSPLPLPRTCTPPRFSHLVRTPSSLFATTAQLLMKSDLLVAIEPPMSKHIEQRNQGDTTGRRGDRDIDLVHSGSY